MILRAARQVRIAVVESVTELVLGFNLNFLSAAHGYLRMNIITKGNNYE